MSNIQPQSTYTFDGAPPKTTHGITSRMTLVDQAGNKLHEVKVSVWSNKGIISSTIALIFSLVKSKWERHEIGDKIVFVNKMSIRNSEVLTDSLKGFNPDPESIKSIKSTLDKTRNILINKYDDQFLMQKSKGMVQVSQKIDESVKHEFFIQKTSKGITQVLQKIDTFGEGSFKTTSKVQDCATKKLYALGKLNIKNNFEHSQNVQMTRDEAKITQQIRKGTGDDPGIINVHQVVTLKGTVGVLSEPCEGGEFTISNLKSKTRKKRIELFLSIVKTMEKVHKAGFVHRDLKPANIMLTKEGQPRLIDFGFAARMRENVPIAGTPIYVPPEIFKVMQEDKSYIEATSHHDVWSLGMILLELTSERDIDASYGSMAGYEVAQAKIDGLKTKCLKSLTPQELKDVLACMLEKDPRKRISLDKAVSFLEAALLKM